MKKASDYISATYTTKLLDPRWRAFASRARQAAGNACSICRRSDTIIQVHHWSYDKGRDPWDYEAWEIAVLCAACHKSLHANLQRFRRYVFPKLTPQSFQIINAALKVLLDQNDPLTAAHAMAEFASNPGLVSRYAESWSRGAMRSAV